MDSKMTASDGVESNCHALRIRHATLNTSYFRMTVSDVSVGYGEIFAVIGANGSGKSSLLEVLLGLRRLSTIDIDMIGIPLQAMISHPANRLRIGAQLQREVFAPEMRIRDLLSLHGTLYGRSKHEPFFHALRIGDLVERPYGLLSRGQRLRVHLILACGHLPDLLLLDEPTSGLDAELAESFLLAIKNDYGPGTRRTVVLTSHNPIEVAIADRVMWLINGKVKDIANMAALIDRHLGSRKTVLTFWDPSDARSAVNTCRGLHGLVRLEHSEDDTLELFGEPEMEQLLETSIGPMHLKSRYSGPTSLRDLISMRM
jgi:ABC-2 type transport system ATP-binding protein